jgi:hypothetical protein
LKELVEFIAKAVVDYPQEVDVSEVEGESKPVIQLKVAKQDLGKIIGKQGRTIQAMRTILTAATTNAGNPYDLELME